MILVVSSIWRLRRHRATFLNCHYIHRGLLKQILCCFLAENKTRYHFLTYWAWCGLAFYFASSETSIVLCLVFCKSASVERPMILARFAPNWFMQRNTMTWWHCHVDASTNEAKNRLDISPGSWSRFCVMGHIKVIFSSVTEGCPMLPGLIII